MKTGIDHKLFWIIAALPVLIALLMPLLRGCR